MTGRQGERDRERKEKGKRTEEERERQRERERERERNKKLGRAAQGVPIRTFLFRGQCFYPILYITFFFLK